MFIEDFPGSDHIYDAEDAIVSLRLKLAHKDYESGRMYLKLEEYESALIYFRSVLNNYYDTKWKIPRKPAEIEGNESTEKL